MTFRKARKAFSLTEILISLIIIGIVGGAASLGLWFAFSAFNQIEDYTTAEREIEQVVQRLSREFALIGLGMPNNADGLGTFAWSFRGAVEHPLPPQPITAFFGPPHGTLPQNPPPTNLIDRTWLQGGPVTVAGPGLNDTDINPATPCNICCNPADNIRFKGPQLFYAFGIPTGVTVRITDANQATYDTPLRLHFFGDSVNILNDFTWQGRNIGLQAAGNRANLRSWLLLPTLRVPMLATGFNPANILNVTVAPMAGPLGELPNIQRAVMGVDEVHLMMAGRVYLDQNTNELRRVLFIPPLAPGEAFPRETLARNIVGLRFIFDHVERILTMDIAAQGIHRGQVRGNPTRPDWFVNDADMSRRIVKRSISWHIRN